MTEPACFAPLDDRGVLAISGLDRVTYLQGLVSNDVRKASPRQALYAAFLTPQGRYLHDFFIAATENRLLLDCERHRRVDLQQRLARFRLRSQVSLEDESDRLGVFAAWGRPAAVASLVVDPAVAGSARPLDAGVVFVDPRLAEAGARVILPPEAGRARLVAAGFVEVAWAAYNQYRLALGLPDSSRDLIIEKSLLLESGVDALHGIDWEKGCYIGQELTARTKYRGLVKKRLVPVSVDGELPAAGTPLLLDGEEVGEMRSGQGERAIVLIRVEPLDQILAKGGVLTAGSARLQPIKPGWAAS